MVNRENLGFIVLLLVATFCMGSSFPTGKFLISTESLPPFFLGGVRFVVAGMIVLAICRYKYGLAGVIPTFRGSMFFGFLNVSIVGLLQTAAAMGFLNLALMRIDSALASVLFFTNPLWVLILAHFTKMEKLTMKRLIGLLLGIFGVILCLKLGKGGSYLGMMFALLGALSWALCTISVRSFCRIDSTPFSLAGWQMLMGGFILSVISLSSSESYDWAQLSGLGWFNLVWLIIPASIGSFSLWFMALQKGGVSQTSSFLFLVPMFATAFAIIFLGEALTLKFVLGCLFIFLAIYLVNQPSKPRQKERENKTSSLIGEMIKD